MNAPRDLLYPYQWTWLQHPAPFKIGMWARQTGKDYTCAAEAVLDCLLKPRNRWLIIACGERQAVESLGQAREIALRCGKKTYVLRHRNPFPKWLPP